MLQRTAEYMKEHKMAAEGAKIVLGLSGGMDSVCLFHVLRNLGYALEAVIVAQTVWRWLIMEMTVRKQFCFTLPEERESKDLVP